MAAGHRENEGKPSRQDYRLGACYRHDPQVEEYISLRDSDRDRFDRLPRSVRMSVGHYQEAKAAAERTGQA